MSKFIVKRDVPILDEHVLKDDDGNPLVVFDERKLHQIAARNNKRIKQTGDLIPLVIGHTKDHAPEETQPEIVGYATDLRVRPFKRTGRKAITAKFLYFKDKVKKARGFPRRSIELWLSDGKIDPISLLGATTPDRDLGLVQLEKSGAVLQFASGGRRKYQRLLDDAKPETENPMDEKAIVGAVMEALKQSAVWKWAESKMQEEAAGDEENGLEGDLGEEEMPDELGGEPGMQDEDVSEDIPQEEEEEEEEPEGEEPVRYNMGGACPAAPSGSNTFTPSYGATNRNPSNMHKKNGVSNNRVQSKGKSPQAPKGGIQRMARNRGEDRLVRYQRAVQNQARQLQEMKVRFQRAERERDLMELSAQGYDFDPIEELDYCSQLPDDHYQYHLNRIKKRYQRAPIGDPRFDLGMSRNPTPAGAGRTAEQAAQIRDYACKKGISYEDAMTEFDGEQTF